MGRFPAQLVEKNIGEPQVGSYEPYTPPCAVQFQLLLFPQPPVLPLARSR